MFQYTAIGLTKKRYLMHIQACCADEKCHLDCKLMSLNLIPSRYANMWPIEDTLTIRPSTLLLLAVFFIMSNNRLVNRK